MSDRQADHDQIAINGRLRVETIDDEVQFWSEFDGWIATVGHKIRGDGLTEAEAEHMAKLWNEQDRIAALEAENARLKSIAKHFDTWIPIGDDHLSDWDECDIVTTYDAMLRALHEISGRRIVEDPHP